MKYCRNIFTFFLFLSVFYPIHSGAQTKTADCGLGTANIIFFSDGSKRCMRDFSLLTRKGLISNSSNMTLADHLSSKPRYALAATSDPEFCRLHLGWEISNDGHHAKKALDTCNAYMKASGNPPECNCEIIIDSGRSSLTSNEFRILHLQLDLQYILGRHPLAGYGAKKLRATIPQSEYFKTEMIASFDKINTSKVSDLPQVLTQLAIQKSEIENRVSTSISATREMRVALVIGNGNYNSKGWGLENPVNDASDMASALRDVGFRVSLVVDANLAQMRIATRDFASVSKEADVALVYFAGHGIEENGKNYMMPVDAEPSREFLIQERAYDASQWLAMLEESKKNNPERVDIIVLDACRDNPLAGFRGRSAGLGRMDAPHGTILVYSTAPGKKASDGRGTRNSPFARHLLRALQEPNLPIEQILKQVRMRVIDETGGLQVPWESSSLMGDFKFR